MGPLTPERLRSWLNGNQPARERMCIGLLSGLLDYTDVRPRRPEGGPDGSRDIDAFYRGQRAVGAVGFRNSARDDAADKKWVSDKAFEDAVASRRQVPNAVHFAFFTNVDLTPREVELLKMRVIETGFATADIFYRERLRVVLDSPDGMAVRFQFLDIELSNAEQAAFFSRFAALAEDFSSSSPGSLRARIERLEFLHYADRPVRQFGISLILRNPIKVRELLGSRAAVVFFEPRNLKSHSRFLLTAVLRRIVPRPNRQGRMLDFHLRMSRRSPWSACNDRTWEHVTDGVGVFVSDPVSRVDLVFHEYSESLPDLLLRDLDNWMVQVELSGRLRELCARFEIIGNDYMIAGAEIACNDIAKSDSPSDWHDSPALWAQELHFREKVNPPSRVSPTLMLNFRQLRPLFLGRESSVVV